MAVNFIQSQRDKHITKEIHRLFWRGHLLDKPRLFIGYFARIGAFSIYHVFLPLISAYGIQAILTNNTNKINGYAIMLIFLAAGFCVFFTLGQVMIARDGITALKYVQNQVYSNFLDKDYEFYSNAYIGSLGAQATRLRDACSLYGEMVTMSIPKQATIVVASIAVIGWQSWLLAGITLVAMIMVLSFTLLTSTWRLQFRRKTSEASSQIASQIGDALTHAQAVKSFANEETEKKRLQKPLDGWGETQFRSWMSAVPSDNGRMILASITTAALLVFSAKLYQQQAISITVVVLIQLYVIKLVAATIDIAEIVKRYEEIMGAAYEPVKTMMLNPTVTDPVKSKRLKLSASYQLDIRNATYHYPDAAPHDNAVNNLSLKVSKGEKIGLVGYSGSGKTTLTKLLLRFMDVTHGSITIAAHDIRKIRQADLRQLIAYVPQEPILFHRTIAENIAYGRPDADNKAIIKAAKQAYVDEFVSNLPKGYETYVGERGVKLSGGQRQRVAIARALLKNAPILLLDEATSSLDSKSEKLIQEALWKLMKNRTAIVIAHRLSTVQRMDKIAVMDKGKIVQYGTHAELIKKSGIYKDLWEHQSGGYLGAALTEQ